MSDVRDGAYREERKKVTVLFADISGFTALSEGLDPEDVTALLNRNFEAIAEVVQRYDGEIHRYIGDEVMVLFGVPRSHEDDPERAVRAALDIMEALREIEAEAGRVEWHLGINTGLVVAGRVGASSQREYTVIGDAVNTASRILDAASDGQILVGESVYLRTRHAIEFAEVDRLEMKGKSGRVAVYEPIRALPHRDRLDIVEAEGLTPFVGRGAELATLEDRLDEASRGRLRVVWVRGAAGQGKSRLVHEFRATSSRRATYLRGHGYPFGTTSAYQPIVELVGRYWGLAGLAGEERRAALTERLERSGLEGRRSAFEDLLELAPTDEGYDALTPTQRKTVISSALIDFLRKIAEVRPAVVLIDDVQWADQSTLDLVTTGIDELADAPILIVLLSRPEFAPPWTDHPSMTAIELAPLPPSDGADLVNALLSPPPAPQLLDYVLRWSGGSPFFAEELIRALLEDDALTANGEYRLARAVEELSIPDTVQGVLGARMDRLEPGPRRVLDVASVVGTSFDREVITEVLDEDAGELNAHLDRLVAGEFIERRRASPGGYRFTHALTREVAYNALLHKTRERAHGEVAQAIERIRPETVQVQPEVLALHYTMARLADRALPLWKQAADRSLQRSANAEAISQVRVALQLIDDREESLADTRMELELQTILGVALITTEGFASGAAKDAYGRARELGARVGDSALLVPALRGLWIFHNMRGEYALARELAVELLELSQQTGDSGLLLEAHRALGITLLAQGEVVEAQREFEHGVGLYDTEEHRDHIQRYGQDPLVAYLVQLSWALTMRGEFTRAIASAEEAVATARGLGHPFSIAGARFMASLALALVGDRARAEEHARACIAVSSEHQFGFMLVHGRILLACTRFEQATDAPGRASALEDIRASLAAYEASGASWILPHYEGRFAAALGACDQREEASAIVERALCRVADTGEHIWEPQLLRVRAELHARQGDRRPTAEEDLETAVRVARRQGSRLFELTTVMSRAGMAEQDQGADVRSALRSVLEDVDTAAEVPVTLEARALLDRVPG